MYYGARYHHRSASIAGSLSMFAATVIGLLCLLQWRVTLICTANMHYCANLHKAICDKISRDTANISFDDINAAWNVYEADKLGIAAALDLTKWRYEDFFQREQNHG
jgi:hypothetical protein